MLASSLDFIYGVPYVHRTVLIYLARGNEFRCSFNFGESIQQNPPWRASPRQARWTTCHKITNMSHKLHFETKAEMLKTIENPQSYTLLSVRQRTLCERMQIWLWNLVDPNRFAVTCHPSLLTECYAALPLPGNKMKISSGIGRISLIRLLKYIKNTKMPTSRRLETAVCSHYFKRQADRTWYLAHELQPLLGGQLFGTVCVSSWPW